MTLAFITFHGLVSDQLKTFFKRRYSEHPLKPKSMVLGEIQIYLHPQFKEMKACRKALSAYQKSIRQKDVSELFFKKVEMRYMGKIRQLCAEIYDSQPDAEETSCGESDDGEDYDDTSGMDSILQRFGDAKIST